MHSSNQYRYNFEFEGINKEKFDVIFEWMHDWDDACFSLFYRFDEELNKGVPVFQFHTDETATAAAFRLRFYD